jgi:hypothetical protein
MGIDRRNEVPAPKSAYNIDILLLKDFQGQADLALLKRKSSHFSAAGIVSLQE